MADADQAEAPARNPATRAVPNTNSPTITSSFRAAAFRASVASFADRHPAPFPVRERAVPDDLRWTVDNGEASTCRTHKYSRPYRETIHGNSRRNVAHGDRCGPRGTSTATGIPAICSASCRPDSRRCDRRDRRPQSARGGSRSYQRRGVQPQRTDRELSAVGAGSAGADGTGSHAVQRNAQHHPEPGAGPATAEGRHPASARAPSEVLAVGPDAFADLEGDARP